MARTERSCGHETDTNTWQVDVHEDQELVAATTDEQLIVLDFEGNVVWREDTSGSLWVEISEDGTSVVTLDNEKPVAYDATTGEEQWRADDAPGLVFERVAISDDGSRVIATEAVGWTYVVDEGKIVWEEQREDNPANVDISADGSMWSVIVQDNDTGDAHAFVYRDADVT